MSRFQYRAINKNGLPVEGQIVASNTRHAIEQLERQGLTIELISTLKLPDCELELLDGQQRLEVESNRRAAVENARAWAAPMSALAKEIDSRKIAKQLESLAGKLAQATSIEQLCHDRETAPVLPFVVHQLSDNQGSESWLERLASDIHNRSHFRRKMLYPVITLVFVIFLLTLGSIYVIPVFEEMFRDFGLMLPPPTRLLLNVSSLIYPHYLTTLTIAALVGLIVWMAFRLERSHGWFNRYAPVMAAGSKSNLRTMSQFTQVLAELLRLSYSLSRAVSLASEACGNPYLKSRIANLVDSAGEKGLKELPLVNPLPPSLVALVNSKTNNQDSIRQLGRLYGDREQAALGKLPELLSQIVIIGAGILIGFSIIAMFLPLMRMVTSLG